MSVKILQQATSLFTQLAAAEHSMIWELEPGGVLVSRAGAGWDEDVTGRTIGAGEMFHPARYALAHQSPLVIPDWPRNPQFHWPPPLREHGVRASLYVAIRTESTILGLVELGSKTPHRFAQAEIAAASVVASLLALAFKGLEVDQMIARRVEEQTRAIEAQRVAAANAQAVLEERQRLARDLHDSVSQSLYGITLHAQAAQRLLSAGEGAQAAHSLRILKDTAQDALDEMRLLIFELRPPILEQVGLVAALQARLSAVEGRANLQTRLVADGVDTLPAAVEQAFYRIAQEALNNALRHARAQQITLQLQQGPFGLTMEISDDGVGFEPGGAGKYSGLGLRGIEERVAQLQGVVTLHSEPGAGTRLRVEVAL